MSNKIYPIGIQNFESLRQDDYFYIDKTALIYQMVKTGRYYFLSRPRRFGKSLLISTLEAYFRGKKELFMGLAIEKLEKDWIKYPILHLDLNIEKYDAPESLDNILEKSLVAWEKLYGAEPSERSFSLRFAGIIERACEQTGQRVVILVDEYDKPMLQAIGNEELQKQFRNTLKAFYGVLKTMDGCIKFALLTGVTKFGKVSVFSDLNNLDDISMRNQYIEICGVSEQEIHSNLENEIHEFAAARGVTYDKLCAELRENYDGYHFTWPSPDIYNPFSLLNAFADGKMNSYWFGSGTPTYLIEMLNKYHVIPQQIGDRKALAESFDAPTERITNITPLLYQSGYITIKGYSPITNLYLLDIPNKEVRLGLMKSLLPGYLHQHTMDGLTTVALLYEAIYEERLDDGLRLLQAFLSTIPYCDNTDYEGHYQSLFYTIFSLLGMYVDVEVRTPRGRVDVVMCSLSALYVMELKLDKTADDAMGQIDLKNYPERFALCGLPVVKVGINFDSERRTLGEWKIEMA